MGKVFAIGHFKTGTSSYSMAVRALGLVDLHFPIVYVRQLHDTGSVQWLPGRWSTRFGSGGYSWVPVPWDSMSNVNEIEYAELDRTYPDSLFVLTTRNVEDWLVSIKKHMSRNWGEKLSELFNYRFRKIFGCDCEASQFDESLFREVFLRHDEAVRDYFGGRGSKRLLVLALEDTNKMAKLTSFVGERASYPKANVTDGRPTSRACGAPGQPMLLSGNGLISEQEYEQAV